MACPQISDGGDGLLIWKVAMNTLNKQSWTAERGWPSRLGVVLNVHAPREVKSDGIKDSFYEEIGCVSDQFSRYDMDILFGDFNAKVGREDIFKSTIGNESTHEISNENGVRVVNFAAFKNLVVRSTMFPHCYSHKYNWTSPEGKTQNQIDHVLIDKRRHSRTLDVRSFRGADCDTDNNMVVTRS
jgi:hypothetical protein